MKHKIMIMPLAPVLFLSKLKSYSPLLASVAVRPQFSSGQPFTGVKGITIHKIIGIVLLLGCLEVGAIESVYVGGEVGHVGLMSDARTTNGIGFGLDLGIRSHPLLQVDFSSQISPHGGDLTLFSETFAANFHFYELSDIDISAGGGPGFYFFKTAGTSNSYFGINFGGAGDVLMAEAFRLGLGFRWHGLFGNAPGNYWTVMMRFGYFFKVDS